VSEKGSEKGTGKHRPQSKPYGGRKRKETKTTNKPKERRKIQTKSRAYGACKTNDRRSGAVSEGDGTLVNSMILTPRRKKY